MIPTKVSICSRESTIGTQERKEQGMGWGPALNILLICNWLAGCFPSGYARGKGTWLLPSS